MAQLAHQDGELGHVVLLALVPRPLELAIVGRRRVDEPAPADCVIVGPNDAAARGQGPTGRLAPGPADQGRSRERPERRVSLTMGPKRATSSRPCELTACSFANRWYASPSS